MKHTVPPDQSQRRSHLVVAGTFETGLSRPHIYLALQRLFLTRAQPACYTLELELPDNLETFRTQPASSRRLWRGQRLLIVNPETTELTLPSRIDAVNEAAAAVAEVLSRSGIA